ncbi:MAG: phosphomannomutase/phosphoglucomutase, partial [Treponema sp.]|nr:phosphomannomutase/phosphoglucomutase [Treponema sp.]
MTAFMKLQNGSDIRGIASEGVEGENVNLTPQIARQIGYAFANWLAKKSGCQAKDLKIGVGRDSRITGPDLAAALMEGIIFAGASVVDCGMATTP